MRLLDTRTGTFHEVTDPAQVRYAILSHVWHKNGEMSYQDVERIRLERNTGERDKHKRSLSLLPHLSAKIRNACALALSEGLLYVWIDTCCIDKTSSAELSEAINSMYSWYAQSTVCYAYLEDARPRSSPRIAWSYANDVNLAQPSIIDCRWFTRAWTLQELIAPRFVVFVDPNWEPFGTKDTYAEDITSVSKVPGDVLRHIVPVDAYSVAARMLWASGRSSSRVEDQAYSLMGIFGVHMPTIYGEGKHAFRRLQDEVLKQDPDQSILVWGPADVFPSWSTLVEHARNVPNTLSTSLGALQFRNPFASSPDQFARIHSQSLDPRCKGTLDTLTPQQLAQRLAKPHDQEALWPHIVVTPVGVETRVPIIPLPSVDPNRPLYAAFLACEYHEPGAAHPLLPVLLLSPLDSRRASYAGATKAALKGGVDFYIIGDICFVPPAVTREPRPSGHVLASFDDICLGFPHASRLKRYHPLPAHSQVELTTAVTDRRGIISPGFRLSLTPDSRELGAWAPYQLSSSTMLNGWCWADGVVLRKLPPTQSLVFTSAKDPEDRVIIRLGPCGNSDPCRQEATLRSDLASAATSTNAVPSTEGDASTVPPSSRPLRAIVTRTCRAGHDDECIPSVDSDTIYTRPTHLESHTEHVASWTWTHAERCFTREFVCRCAAGHGLRIVLSVQPWWPSVHPSAYSDTYGLGIVIRPL